MPISKEKRALYPKDWQDIRAAVLLRAGGVCEWEGCGAKNGRLHPVTGSLVVLTCAHLDHDPSGRDIDRILALCQYHHLRYYAKQHAASAAATRRRKMATGELFDGTPQVT